MTFILSVIILILFSILEYNIDFTRQGYSIDEQRITEELYPIGRDITSSVTEANK